MAAEAGELVADGNVVEREAGGGASPAADDAALDVLAEPPGSALSPAPTPRCSRGSTWRRTRATTRTSTRSPRRRCGLRPPGIFTFRTVVAPFELDDETPVAPGTILAPVIAAVHRRPDIYPEADRFLPDRFVGIRPGTYTWVPGSVRFFV